MMFRVCAVPFAALLTWWITWRPDNDNWMLWIAHSDSWFWWKLVWGLMTFGAIVGIAACFILLGRRSLLLLIGVAGTAYLVANFIGWGYRSSNGMPMEDYAFISLVLSMTASIPMAFSDLLAGKQIDVVGDEK